MRERFGDLWSLARGSVLVLTTNGVVRSDGACVMGRGCALEGKTRFPSLPFKLGSYIQAHGNRAFNLGVWGDWRIATMPVKHRWNEAAVPELIARSAAQLVEMADKFGWKEVFVPRPGCGNGSLSWDVVRPILEAVLDDRFVIVTWEPR